MRYGAAVYAVVLVTLTCIARDTTTALEPLRYYTPDVLSERTVQVSHRQILVDGQPFRFVAGSIHYFRVPAEYWADRLRKLRQAGLNAVTTYVEWRHHEPQPRNYLWEYDMDLLRFIDLAAEEGLFVLLRPGPYICAERDFGGLPHWLLTLYPSIKIRTVDSDFMFETETWLTVLFQKISSRLYGNGGPIIMVQVENEYGSYKECNMEYRTRLRDFMRRYVKSNNSVLYTTDGTGRDYLRCGAIPGVLPTIDFGTKTNVGAAFALLESFRPGVPSINSEFYPGWLTHWGESRAATVEAREVVITLRAMLQRGASVNFYMFFGGTNFGFTAGANTAINQPYAPDLTSYDYDAPLNEAGDPTMKYFAIAEVMAELFPNSRLPPPTTSPKMDHGPVPLRPILGLLSRRGRATLATKNMLVTGPELPTFEALDQFSGFVLYETSLPFRSNGSQLVVNGLHDRAIIYINGKMVGLMSRTFNINSITIYAKRNDALAILVENQGRVNYGPKMTDYKGILGQVKLANSVLDGEWRATSFPLDEMKTDVIDAYEPPDDLTDVVDPDAFDDTAHITRGPILYKGEFVINKDDANLDTFVDPDGWVKGIIWINGVNLGRYWPTVGPQRTLYLPAPYLNAPPEVNEIYVLELQQAPKDPQMTLADTPILEDSGTETARGFD